MVVIPDKEKHSSRPAEVNTHFDAVVVGAGFGGLYMLHRLRELGLSVRVYETGGGVGGTWYWNRYPGARCDVESMQYSYSFSEALEQEWEWSEKYAPQPEILQYANYVASKFDLRKDIFFETRVIAAAFDEGRQVWHISTDKGDIVEAQFCVMAVGCLSAANRPNFERLDMFTGEVYHTGEWPHEGVDFTGQNVGVIGTGSSAIQSIPLIAKQAKSLSVFQRTPNYSVPAWNTKLDSEYQNRIKAEYPDLRAKARGRPSGVMFPFNFQPALDPSDKERATIYEEFWARGGLPFLGAFSDLLFDSAANETAAEFARNKIREIVKDPETAKLLCPSNVFGCKRLCVDSGYFQTFNEPHVNLIDISKKPIERFYGAGIVINGTNYELDAVVFATGFAAMTGSFDKINITGRNGLKLLDKWRAGPRTYLGLSTSGFPNFFMITGPGSPSVLASMIQSIEQHVDWMADCIGHIKKIGARTIEPTEEYESDWVEHVTEVSKVSLRSTCSSWYVGANIEGRPRVFMPYIGGFPVYVDRCNDVMSKGFEGFLIDGEPDGKRIPKIKYTERWRVVLDKDVMSPADVAALNAPVL
ncbi:MAG: cyclohexanone monooxygenase [Rhodospirillaceae bacterium]|nr:cyclohexanone monooxygenase [Rhodospirillaceae bacterium]|tara:strand:+ start:1351 stop:3105 length:1755 start_codon:yes stop_codon:yes gene_type:complete